MNSTHSNILILGAGIGGYETFRTLANLLKRSGFKQTITIVDQNNYFTFTPLLHEVASGAVEPTHATLPLRALVCGTPHKFVKAKVDRLDPLKKIVKTSAGDFTYDYCVLALGSATNYYRVPGAEKNSYHVRSLGGAMKLRHNLIELLESDLPEIKINIVGGGYTGVELAGQLAYFKNRELAKLYPNKKITLSLIHNLGILAPLLPPKASEHIAKRLKAMGVEFYLSKEVAEVTPTEIKIKNGEAIKSNFTIWCTGFENMATCFLDDPFCLKGRMPTTGFLNHEQAPTLYAVGDIAYNCNPGSDKPQPQLGEAAHAEGRYVARHILATLKHQNTQPFRFKSRGTLMPIGDWHGVAIFGNWVFYGWLAWWIRRTVYLMFMPGFWHKIKIVIDWTLHSFGFGNVIAAERGQEKGPTYN